MVKVAFALVLLLCFAVRPTSSPAATFFVAQGDKAANDDGPGDAAHPWKTLARAARAATAGDRVEIRDGIYREQVVLKNSGSVSEPIRFEAAPDAAEVVLTGADRLEHWTKADSSRPIYQVAWPHRFIPWSKHMTHPDDEYHRLIGRSEQVIIDNYFCRQVLDAAQMAPGTFWAGVTNGVLQVWDAAGRDPNHLFVEASVRQEILHVDGSDVHVRGLHFRYAANMAQHGAVVLGGARDRAEDCVFEGMNSSGATFAAADLVVRRCIFRDNGQLGFGANQAHQLLFTDCLVENNNVKGFDRGWEAGGDKLVLCRGAVLERSRFVRNRGHGIWFDIGNEDCVVQQCFISDNEDSGIFCEISYNLQAHDNVIAGNGFATTPGAWGAQAGISLSSSPGCVVERNLIVGNREGFDLREQTRTTPRIAKPGEESVWNHDEQIRRNLIADNRDAQVWGWFDVHDGRQWPAGAEVSGKPPGALTLEKLNLHFDQNIYFAGAGQGWFEWGVPWAVHHRYDDLKQFQDELSIDREGRVVNPAFANRAAHDYRVSPASLAELRQCYPRGAVPEVLLGARP